MSFNGYLASSYVRANPGKLVWRLLCDQRGDTDRFSIESTTGSGVDTWMQFDSSTGTATFSGTLQLGNGSLRPITTSSASLGDLTHRWSNIHSEKLTAGSATFGRYDQSTMGHPLQIHDSRCESTESGQIFIEAGRTTDGANSGWSAINWNGYHHAGERVINQSKTRWRQVVDQRSSTDMFSIDTQLGSSATGYSRPWMVMNVLDGSMKFNESLLIDFRPDIGSRYVRPTTTGNFDLGASSFAWRNVYATGSVITTSDKTKKDDIVDITKGLDYIVRLRPVEFKMKNGTSGRVHCGLISQEVEALHKSMGDTDGKGNAIVVKAKKMIPDPDWVKPKDDNKTKPPLIETEDYNYFLRYEELISPMIKAIQELSSQVASLKAKLLELEKKD